MTESFILRKELKNIKRLVVKLGSTAITSSSGGVDLGKIGNIVEDIASLHKDGLEIILISSGAVQTGRQYLSITTDKKDMASLQALSSIGQPRLMDAYDTLLREKGILCAQVLLTHDDFKNRERYLNARNTLSTLLKHKVIPILNENDSVSFDEIAFGDNDQLGAITAEMMGADLFLLLTLPDGLYGDGGDGSNTFDLVKYDQKFEDVSLSGQTQAGKGGMKSKLEAVRKLTPLGIPVVIATFTEKSSIVRALTKENSGTFFEPNPTSSGSRRKGWLLTTVKDNSYLKVDKGARNALLKGASLLPAGIKETVGKFKRGDCIGISCGHNVFAAGLSEYDAKDVRKLMGRQGSEVKDILPHAHSIVIIHRNNLALKE
jgi:glutamate 5-kinase